MMSRYERHKMIEDDLDGQVGQGIITLRKGNHHLRCWRALRSKQ
jgi:hypothetical protein